MSITRIISIGMLGTIENNALPVTVFSMTCFDMPISFPCLHARNINRKDWQSTYRITRAHARNITGESAMDRYSFILVPPIHSLHLHSSLCFYIINSIETTFNLAYCITVLLKIYHALCTFSYLQKLNSYSYLVMGTDSRTKKGLL